ncbi:peptide chain release factor N(5)-glutamine methyltransferase [Prevotella sp. E13-17]|uniref:peptide chain release factor N(5)-glutamine methyltransferase n=1 Tax=Prevotella sp. E13-17 TaxID=2913616 RepID=UPI001EDA09C8|nr:peptide chain release factor N(5)-glutamine methyltransferase [Prevotella sp. E13-17]UKK50548.1 peptide chain release factor N(5)-glutamine methyltransferase [Prevotella sp. E13-17]
MTYEEFWKPLTAVYEAGEAKAIARMVMEVRFGLSMTDIICGKTGDEDEMLTLRQRLLTGEPVQYVLGQADFGGRTFHVEPGVLIPRPETYELCQWSLPPTPSKWKGHILDIGTGSGCIACTLAAEIPNAEVTAWDISDEALRIAAENAKRTNVHVSFEKVDILNPPLLYREGLGVGLDIIVSNPPYICNKERAEMERNVLEHEPELALFVPDDNPLLFYRAIARFAQQALLPDGCLYFEINPIYVNDMKQMLCDEGFKHTEVRNDQYNKQRFTKSWR